MLSVEQLSQCRHLCMRTEPSAAFRNGDKLELVGRQQLQKSAHGRVIHNYAQQWAGSRARCTYIQSPHSRYGSGNWRMTKSCVLTGLVD